MTGLVVQVRTRSKVHDYRFVGASPPERWWEKNYGRWADFSRPTILVEPGRFFVSGIGSARTDSRGARIHYALHAQVEPAGHALAAQVLAWVCDVRQRTGSLDEVGMRLDTLGDDAWSAAVLDEPGAADKLDAAVMSLLRDIPILLEAGEAPQPFVVAATEAEAFARLGALAARVLAQKTGDPKRAVYLNLASSSELASLPREESAIVCREVDTRPKSSRPLLAGVAFVMLVLIVAAVILLQTAPG